jgi:hypothetical protein
MDRADILGYWRGNAFPCSMVAESNPVRCPDKAKSESYAGWGRVSLCADGRRTSRLLLDRKVSFRGFWETRSTSSATDIV